MPSTPTTPATETRVTQPAPGNTIDRLIEGYADQPRCSARTLLSTIFGDSVEAHGGIIWLGSLIDLLAPLRISERLVRTSIHRLVLEGFLVARQVGRRSYYSVTESAGRTSGMPSAGSTTARPAPGTESGPW